MRNVLVRLPSVERKNPILQRISKTLLRTLSIQNKRGKKLVYLIGPVYGTFPQLLDMYPCKSKIARGLWMTRMQNIPVLSIIIT